MSWIKRRGQTTPSPGAPAQGPPQAPQVPMYNPNQHSLQENQWQPQQQAPQWFDPNQIKPETQHGQQQNYWQNPQQSYGNQGVQASGYSQNTQMYDQYRDQQQSYYNPGYQQVNQQSQSQQFANMQYNQHYNQNNSFVGHQQQQQQQQNVEGDAWNWGWGDEDNSNVQAQPPATGPPPSNQTSSNTEEKFSNDSSWNWSLDDKTAPPKTDNTPAPSNEEVYPKFKPKSNDSERPQTDHLTVTGKRGKLETPQWSVESQMSQESSDDILHTSESDKSHMLSRSSTISHSPISGQDSLPVTSNYNVEDVTVKNESFYPEEASFLQSHFENKEMVNSLNSKQEFKVNSTPPPQITQTPPLAEEENPYKRSGLSHKYRAPSLTPPETKSNFQFGQANLETLPDNSEQPDRDPPLVAKPPKVPVQWRENNEAPINDRNQYLETGQLSESNQDFGRGIKVESATNDALPPPGLRRMVLGQIEQPEQSVQYADEPPPGLSRMVLGQTESATSNLLQAGPPEGLHRMVPGESSSPETTRQRDENVSEPEFEQLQSGQPRSATIGADTPPVVPPIQVNRSETIGGTEEGDNDLGSITNSVRNLTVGDTSPAEAPRRHSRQETSDSEQEVRKPRNKEKRDKRRDLEQKRDREYSPDSYKNKQYDRRRYRDRRYDDDTDYYSDKEARRNREDREYEKKYSSLRKDKEKDRKRREPREYSRRNDYYYDNDYEQDNRSRPSSRDSMQESGYRERRHEREHRDRRNRDRDRERYRRHPREPQYNPYQEYAYDPYNPYYQQYQYYKNLRRTNPQAYAAWYRKYYQQATAQSSTYGEDRASVHSGRSSANDELAKDRYTRQSYYSQASLPHLGDYYGENHMHSLSNQYGLDNSSFVSRPYDQTDASVNFEESSLATQRLTPAKFSTAHVKANISSGKLLKVLANYPMDGDAANVEIHNLNGLLVNDDEFVELNAFPGPLSKGVSHKKTIIEYCENKIKGAGMSVDVLDVESYVLMWELLILLIRQNGMVVGTDIAELLLKNRDSTPARPPSVISNLSSTHGEVIDPEKTGSSTSILKEEEVTSKFREFLLYGSGKEALEWAMKHGLWGHALFLASKLDKRTYANVMMRFANGLTLNDPLQTLYQLLSGKMPAAVTCVSDEKWGDWRPHLAMILSNSTQRPELNCKAITALGDTLLGRGSLFAAQFCYLMAEVGFGKHGQPETKLVLLGSNHTKNYPHFATNEAIHMTEVYEYACSLNDPNFIIPEFQQYKYLVATRLADRGLLEKSLAYLEKVSAFIVANPSTVEQKLAQAVYSLSDKLQFYDPVGEVEDESEFGSLLETSRPENSWLKDLRSVVQDFNAGLIQAPINNEYEVSNDLNTENNAWQPNNFGAQQWSAEPPANQAQVVQNEYQTTNNLQDFSSPQFVEQPSQPNWQQDQQQQWGEQVLSPEPISYVQEEYYGANNAQNEPKEVEKAPPEEPPQISMPNQSASSKPKSIFDDEPLPQEKKSPVKAKPGLTNQPEQAASTGWFGGIFSKLALKPKNQMKLPDDKNPKIVWDQEKKRWVNVDEDNGEGGNEFKPPPKMGALMPKPSFNGAPSEAKIPEGGPPDQNSMASNMFKMQRSRNLKKSYIDVFNPGGSNQAPPMQALPQNSTPQMNYFMPQQVNDPNAPMDFLTPAPPMTYDPSQLPQ